MHAALITRTLMMRIPVVENLVSINDTLSVQVSVMSCLAFQCKHMSNIFKISKFLITWKFQKMVIPTMLCPDSFLVPFQNCISEVCIYAVLAS